MGGNERLEIFIALAGALADKFTSEAWETRGLL